MARCRVHSNQDGGVDAAHTRIVRMDARTDIVNEIAYPPGITSDNIPAKLEGFAFDDADLGAGSSGLERQEFSDHLCDDDAWQTFHRDACDDHRH